MHLAQENGSHAERKRHKCNLDNLQVDPGGHWQREVGRHSPADLLNAVDTCS